MISFLKEKKENLILILFCFMTSFLVLALTSKCSFLYPFNDWVDANAFFTVGKAMMNGVVPYLDVFEQKGLLLYLIYGIGYFISNTSFLGIFFLEVLFWTATLYYVHKINLLFFDSKISLLLLPIFISLVTTSNAFVHGGSAEEFGLFFLAITLYYFLSYWKEKEISYQRIFVAGFCAGCILLIKYTMLGFWFAFMACLFFCRIAKKEYKKAFLSCAIFLFAMALPFGVSLIYMGLHHGIKEYFRVYFLLNMTAYGDVSLSFIKRMSLLFQIFFESLRSQGLFTFLLLLFFPLFVGVIPLDRKGKVCTFVLVIFTILGIYFGLKSYAYYFLPIEIFLIFSIIGIVTILNKYAIKYIRKYLSFIKYPFFLLGSLLLSLVLSYFCANYKDFRFQKKEDLFQYQFAQTIQQYDNPTLVNMGFLDCGVFTMSNLLPSTYFFEKQNFSYQRFKENLDAFQTYIKEKRTLFIVYYTKIKLDELQKKEPLLFQNYELIEWKEQKFQNKIYVGYLFLRKEDNV